MHETMMISTYQIKNILNSYNRQLRLGRIIPKRQSKGAQAIEDYIQISLEAKRKQSIEKAVVQVKEWLTSKQPQK